MSDIDGRTTGMRKFGRNPDVDAAEDIWDGGGDYTFLDVGASVGMFVSSSDAADTVVLYVEGLDGDGALQTTTITLAGQTKTAIPTLKWQSVHRAYVTGTTAADGDIYVYIDDTVTAGVPDTASKIKAKVTIAAQQTLMSVFRVPASVDSRTIKKAWLTGYNIDILSGTAAATKGNYSLRTRPSGGVFTAKDTSSFNSDVGTHYTHEFKKYLELSPLTDIKIRCDSTDKANADIGADFTLFYEFG